MKLTNHLIPRGLVEQSEIDPHTKAKTLLHVHSRYYVVSCCILAAPLPCKFDFEADRKQMLHVQCAHPP